MGKSISPKAKDRRSVITVLRNVTTTFNAMKNAWNVTGEFWDFGAPRDEHGNVAVRPRRVDEYPEMSRVEWHLLATQCDDLAQQLLTLREFAWTNYNELTEAEYGTQS